MTLLRYFFTLLFILLASSFLLGQASGNYIYSEQNLQRYKQKRPIDSYEQAQQQVQEAHFAGDKIIILESRALMNKKADAYLAIFNLTQLGETAASADQLLNSRYENFVEEVASYGIEKANIMLDMLSLVPVYEYEVSKKLFSKTYNEIPKGFELQKNIHIQYTNASQLDKIVTAAAKNEIYDLVKVEYFIDHTEVVYDSLRQRAIQHLLHKVADFKQLGIELDTVYRVVSEHSSVVFPESRYEDYTAFSSNSLDALLNKRDKATQIRKPKTVFYNKLGYESFDIVVNPRILEPVAQYTYTLKLKFIIKDTPPAIQIQRDKEFLWLTPNGEVKRLKIEKE